MVGVPRSAKTDGKDAIALAQRKAVILNDDLQQVTAALEAAAIWYMPLKGTVLKDLYPRFAMREMADVDVLFDAERAGEVKTIMESLGFQVKAYGENNDDDYNKPPLSNFEMHKALFGERHDTFFNYPILLPFLPFYRLFRALKKSPKRIKAEAKALKNAGKANEAR